MKTRTWILIIGIVLVLSLGASVFLLLPKEAAAHAEITSDGKLWKTVDLRIDQEFSVDTAKGHNTVTVKDGRIAVTEANCPDHYCMQRGFCNAGSPIVCLPNKLVISFVGAPEVDFAVG